MKIILLLQHYGITPIVVFDGLPLPLKQTTPDERRRNPQASLKQGLELYKHSEAAAAKECFQRPVTVASDMTIDIIRKLTEKKIQCIVTPSEAAAQLTHLTKTGKVAAVVTENTENANLLAFGCPKFICNMDATGNGIEICMDKVMNEEKSPRYKYDPETIRHVCILSGSDYLPPIKGVGIKTILKRYTVKLKSKPKDYSLRESITKKFLAFADSTKENIEPLHLGLPFFASSPRSPLSPRSPKSPKSPKSPLGAKSRQVLSEAKLPQSNGNYIEATSSRTGAPGELSSCPSRPNTTTKRESLEEIYRRICVIPRQSCQAAGPSLDGSNGSSSISLQTDNSKSPSSSTTTAAKAHCQKNNKKRSFDQMEDSASAIQGSSGKKHTPPPPPPPSPPPPRKRQHYRH
ncbi:unnamed protein product [Mucor fragilis]